MQARVTNMHRGNPLEDDEDTSNLSFSSSFVLARCSSGSWRSSSSLSDAVTIQSDFTEGRHIGAPEIEEIPDYRWLPFSPVRKGPVSGANPVSVRPYLQTPARGNMNNTKRKWGIQASIRDVMIFSRKEIRDATDNFNGRQLLSEDDFCMIYKGKMPQFPQHPVAIKVPNIQKKESLSFMVNEISIISRIKHRNLANLIGVCLEEKSLCCVYEFFPNGTLLDNIIQHGRLTWVTRLKIALEIAEALTYLHSLLPAPVIHRGIKSSNIYLDGNDTAKMFSFGMAIVEGSGEDCLVTPVANTSYLDPEYFHRGCTGKTDSYSFGFLLAQLLTSCKHPYFEKPEERCYLYRQFNSNIREDTGVKLFDREIANADMCQMKLVARLAGECLTASCENRPSMAEVAMSLKQIWNSNLPRHVFKTNQDF